MAKNVIEIIIQGKDDASKVLKDIDVSMRDFKKGAAAVAATVTGVVVATSALVVSMASIEDQMYSTAIRLGTTAEELSKWQKVADYANVPTETFNMSLQFLNRNLASAAQGSGEAAEKFSRLGIDVGKFTNLPLGEKLTILNEKFGNVSSAAEKTQLAMSLFGRGGAQMVQLLDGNSKAMAELAARVDRLGGSISNVAAANAEQFMDSLGEVQMALGGLSRAFADIIIPIATPALSRIAEIIADWQKPLKEFTEQAVRYLIAFAFLSQDTFDKIKIYIKDALTPSNTEAAVMRSWGPAFEGLLYAVAEFSSAAIDIFGQFYDSVAVVFKLIWAAWDEFSTAAVLNTLLHISTFAKEAAYGLLGAFKWAWQQIKNLFNGDELKSFSESLQSEEYLKDVRDSMASASKEWEDNHIKMGDVADETMRRGAEAINKYRQQFHDRWSLPEIDSVTGPQAEPPKQEMIFGIDFGPSLKKADEFLAEWSKSSADAADENKKIIAGRLSEAEAWSKGMGALLGDPMKNYYDSFKNTADATLAEADAWGQGMGALLGDPMTQYYLDWEAQRQQALANEVTMLEELGILWGMYYESQGTLAEDFGRELYDIMQRAVDSISQGIAQVIVNGQNLLQTFRSILKTVLVDIVASFVKIGIERLVINKLMAVLAAKEGSGEVGKAAVVGAANMTASMAAAPFPANLGAVGAGIALGSKIAGMAPLAVSAAAGIAHGGLDFVPRESTYLLDRGERVLSPRQNRDLTDYINTAPQDSAPAGNVTIENVNITVLPNATNADSLLRMSAKEMENVVAGPILAALNSLSRKGVKMEYLEMGVR